MTKTQPTPEPMRLGQSARLRLYAEDEETLKRLHDETGLSMEELKRRAVHSGLAVISKQLQPVVKLAEAGK